VAPAVPVARGPRVDARSALIVGASGVVVALVILGMVLWLSSRDDIQVRLGDDRFQDYDAQSAAAEIRDRGPILFPDPANRGRDILLQHLGDDHEQGWFAFDARPLGEDRACFLRWEAETRTFVDNGKCSRSFTFPEDGEGLPQYPATVDDDGKVVVDLNAADRATTTTESTTASTTGSTTDNGEG
jgi:hypothetical protein